jgi:hypothetical protein
MSGDRKPLFSVNTPFPAAPSVTLYEDTWTKHIVPGHLELAGKEADIQTVVTSPSVVVAGSTNPNYVAYVSDTVTSSGGTPLAVIVDPQEQVICTAYYNRSFKVISPEQVLWSPSETK